MNKFHHGGYAKSSHKLEAFVADFSEQTGIPVEVVYTGKLFYALFEMIFADYFKPNTKILAIHTGGLRN